MYQLCESNGIVLKVKVYCGKSDKCEKSMDHALHTVLHLVENYLHRNYILYMDNFDNSVALTKLRKTYVLSLIHI